MRTLTALATALLFAIQPVRAEAQDLTKVDVMLVLSADVSPSVSDEKFKLQREGYAAAIRSKRFLEAARIGAHRKIALTYIEWSNEKQQAVVVPWAIIDCAEAAETFAERLMTMPRAFPILGGGTAIGDALLFSALVVEKAPFKADRIIIDVSGDGTSVRGTNVKDARDKVVKDGIVINGLVILSKEPTPWPHHTNPPGGLAKYYEDHVIGGEGSFVVTASGFETFAEAVYRKLIREIAAAMGPRYAMLR